MTRRIDHIGVPSPRRNENDNEMRVQGEARARACSSSKIIVSRKTLADGTKERQTHAHPRTQSQSRTLFRD